MSKAIINTAVILRQIVIGQVQAIPEQAFDHQPEGVSNTIRWNTGHVVSMLEFFLSMGIPFRSGLPASHAGLFLKGTKPADWTVTPPSKEELIQYLSAQQKLLSEVSPVTLNEPLQVPFEMGPLKLVTVGELFNFALMHEAIHLGIITSLAKLAPVK
ncbi:DinB family protein [Paenibacillus sp. SI8]|uniref:DinB family protein n=1 Tax=unclassified Paenibacillus TaxID=185978 RepID=UPI0034660ABE